MTDHCCGMPSLKSKSQKPKFGMVLVAIILSFVSMILAMPEHFSLTPNPWFFWASFGVASVVTIGFGKHFWLSIPKIFWSPGMNTLIGLGVAASYGLSFWIYFSEKGSAIYFDSAAFITSFVLLGQQIENWIYYRVEKQLPDWMSFLPKHARLMESGETREVLLKDLQVGQHLLIAPGERLSVDAQLISENAEVDESLVTGESKPVHKTQSQVLLQGSLNLGQPIEVKSLKANQDSFYSQLVVQVETNLHRKSLIQSRADRWSAILSPIVVLIALGAGVYWGWFKQDYQMMVMSSVSVLVIACPCVLGLATPIALFVAVIRAARRGILLKDLDVVDRAEDISVVAFDKTGTLTEGQPEIEKILTIENLAQRDVLQWAASLEQAFDHPFARAFLRKAKEENIKLFPIQEPELVPGKGIRAKIIKDQKTMSVVLGNMMWLYDNSIEPSQVPQNLLWEAEGTGASVLWMAVDSKVMGIFILSDNLRKEAFSLVQDLRAKKWQVGLVTGDAENVAREISKKLQLDFYHFGVTPDEKSTIVKRLSEKKKKGMDVIFPKVLFVGDGINDAPALAEAHLGIALGSGTALAQHSASIILSSPRLSNIRAALEILRETKVLITQNLSLAFVYNLLAIPIAAGVIYSHWGVALNPSIAALAMSLSSISLVANSVRSLRR
ncbi:MAG: heavy metal translocating P-type ATPase [Bdellovibrionota bacterium]